MNSRIYEPSTWAGIGAVLQGVKFFVPAYAGLIDGLSMAAGGLAVALREGGASQPAAVQAAPAPAARVGRPRKAKAQPAPAPAPAQAPELPLQDGGG